MSNWPGKYVIGLTGNIATGKSVVRRMLEHLGAYTIDADALSHRVIAKGAPGYQPVLDKFGTWLLEKDGQINRSKLGRLVFADGQALAELEDIIHPYVGQAMDILASAPASRSLWSRRSNCLSPNCAIAAMPSGSRMHRRKCRWNGSCANAS